MKKTSFVIGLFAVQAVASAMAGVIAHATEFADIPGFLVTKTLDPTAYVLEDSDQFEDQWASSGPSTIPTIDLNRSPAILGPATAQPSGPNASLYPVIEETLFVPIGESQVY